MAHLRQNASCAVLIVSCDRYRDLWDPCITLFRRFWADCPYPVYLLSNTVEAQYEGIRPITVGSDISWSDNLLAALAIIPEDYVLLWIEDLFLIRPVESEKIRELIEWAIRNHINYLRLNPTPGPDIPLNQDIGQISKGTVYRASVVFSVWKKSLLSSLLRPGENAWEFEDKGTERTDSADAFYASSKQLIPACNTVIKGVWEKSALGIIRRLGIEPDLNVRRVMNRKESIIWKLKLIRSRIFFLLPSSYRRKIRSFFS